MGLVFEGHYSLSYICFKYCSLVCEIVVDLSEYLV